jgi:hypothetical protein
MSYDEEQQRRSRVVVETPTARREVVQTQTTRIPEKSGFSTGMVAAVALTAIAATAIIFLFLMNRGDEETNVNVSTRAASTPIPQPSTLIVQQPATQATPIIIQQAPPISTQPAPVIITQPAPASDTASLPPTAKAPSVPDDSAVQNSLSKKLQDDADVGATDIIATFGNGRATLTGTVNTSDLKRRAERLALSVKGVRTVDNQIAVLNAPQTSSTP